MQAANRLRRALTERRTSYGGWQTLPGSNLSRVLARTPGLDWICLDCEHGNISDEQMHECVAAIAACGVSPLVRIPDGQHWMIKRALDAGAHGIVVPLLSNVEEAKSIARFTKFPPEGNRGLGSALSMEKFISGPTGEVREVTMAEYFSEANTNLVTIVQIETKTALDQVREIAEVDGIDVLFVGPTDLGNSIGHPSILNNGVFSPELNEAILKIRDAAHGAGKCSGIYTGSGEAARKYAAAGFSMINAANDLTTLKKGFASNLAEARAIA